MRVLIRINENASNEKYRKDEQSQNFTIFLNLRNFTILLIFKFDNLQIVKILTISKIIKFS